MKENSTTCILKIRENGKYDLSMDMDKGPRHQTIDWLQQFARSYHAESSLNTRLNGFVLN